MTWSEVSLSDVCSKITDGAHNSPPSRETGFPMGSVKDMTDQGINLESCRKISEQDYEKLCESGCKPLKGDVLIAKDGNSCLETVCLQEETLDLVLLSSVAILRPNTEICDPRFLKYHLSNSATKAALRNYVSGAAIPRVVLRDFKNYKFAIPSRAEQSAIADVLESYDLLIKNNKRRIALLEESACQLYKEWFVRFRFPGHEHVKVVGGVPEGWLKRTYGAISQTIGGGTPSTKVNEYWDNGDVTWFTPKDLTNNNSLVLLGSEKKITKFGLQKSSAKLLPPNTIMMSSRASIGYFGLFDGEAATNQGFISIIPNNEKHRMYLLHNLMARKEEIINLAGGSTYKEINKTTFRNMEVIIPSESLVEEFEEIIRDTVSQVRLLMRQNAKLIQARDLLLPKLMSGELAL